MTLSQTRELWIIGTTAMELTLELSKLVIYTSNLGLTVQIVGHQGCQKYETTYLKEGILCYGVLLLLYA